ncbi:uncharacterized protein LOC108034121 [Drosophila biarmipes]|uniref:uncharacterized protein LOC108034121 n=1 Tax=Drosophila biarmipes TaxID=125945 RepID=UPI001CDB09E8|nr:uncharacterized protein LOC108034121 [Drosophila biarmipes]
MSDMKSMVNRKRPLRSQSETNTKCSRAALLEPQRSRSQDSRQVTRESQPDSLREASSQSVLEEVPSRRSSITTIGSADLSESNSETSGYTTESSYQTAPGYERLAQTSSYASVQNSATANYLREIHVAIDALANHEEIQSVHRDLRELLTNEMALVGGTSGPVIYLIAYNYM